MITSARMPKRLQAAGAARMILQQDLTGERLAQEIAALVDAPGRVTRMEEASRKLARGDAAAATVDLMEELVSQLSVSQLSDKTRTQNSSGLTQTLTETETEYWFYVSYAFNTYISSASAASACPVSPRC